MGRERAELALQLRENEEEMTELIKKYKASVAAGSTDQITIQDQAVNIQVQDTKRYTLALHCTALYCTALH